MGFFNGHTFGRNKTGFARSKSRKIQPENIYAYNAEKASGSVSEGYYTYDETSGAMRIADGHFLYDETTQAAVIR